MNWNNKQFVGCFSRTDLNQYDAGEFPTQNSELLGDIMQHPWLLDNSQVNQMEKFATFDWSFILFWYFHRFGILIKAVQMTRTEPC